MKDQANAKEPFGSLAARRKGFPRKDLGRIQNLKRFACDV